MTFTDRKTGREWSDSEVIGYINQLKTQVKALKSANTECTKDAAVHVYHHSGLPENQERMKQILEESRQRVRSGKVYGDIPNKIEVESSSRIKSGSVQNDQIPASWNNYRRLIEGSVYQDEVTPAKEGKVVQASKNDNMPASWNNYRRFIDGGVQ